YHENGQVARRLTYVAGRRHGPVEVFDETGKSIQVAYYENDQLRDSVKTFFPDGEIRKETMLVKGKPEGQDREYFPNGSVKREITYRNGKPNGIARTYYENGHLETEANYEDGVLTGFLKTYYDNGQMQTVSTMAAGARNGSYQTYDREGRLILEGNFLEGQLEGPNTAYFPDGAVQHRFQYKAGRKVGSNYEYYPNGQVRIKETGSHNGVDLTRITYDENGLVISEQKFRNEKPHGTWTYYHEGTKTMRIKETYDAGKLSG